MTKAIYQAVRILGLALLFVSCLNTQDEGELNKLYGELMLRPDNVTMMINSSLTLIPSGGQPPYTYSVVSGGGVIDEVYKQYNAPSEPGHVILQIEDSVGDRDQARIEVVNTLQITPVTPTVVIDSTEPFAAMGGVPPYSYSIITGGVDGNAIDPVTGLFTAAPTPGTAAIKVQDAAGNISSTTVAIVLELSVTPTNQSVPDGKLIEFQAQGGKPPFSFEVLPESTVSASIDSETGELTTPYEEGTLYVRVTDSLGHTADSELGVFIRKRVATGRVHTCATTSENDLKCWGSNYLGQLGSGFSGYGADGSLGDALPYVNLGTNKYVVKVVTAPGYGCAIIADSAEATSGNVRCWGRNSDGRLGTGDKVNYGEEPNTMGDKIPMVASPTASTNYIVAKDLALDSLHVCALGVDERTVTCWGRNAAGAIGVAGVGTRGENPGETLPQPDLGLAAGETIIDLSIGFGTNCALLNTGQIKCWGAGRKGQIGNGFTDDVGDTPEFEMGANLIPVILGGAGRQASKVVVGNEYACAILSAPASEEGGVVCWGDNSAGQLGWGSSVSLVRKLDEPAYNSPILLTNSSGSRLKALDISTIGNTTCAVLEITPGQNRLKCWGGNSASQTGTAGDSKVGDSPADMGVNLPFVDLGDDGANPYNVVGVSAGVSSTCARLEITPGFYGIKCWGQNYYYSLGHGVLNRTYGAVPSTMGNNLPIVSLGTDGPPLSVDTVLAPMFHNDNDDELDSIATCAVLANRQLKCWGRSFYGNLGMENPLIGDHPHEMGHLLPKVKLGTGRKVKEIVAYEANNCALLDNGQVKCWGEDNSALGFDSGAGTLDHVGDFLNEMGDNLPALNLGLDPEGNPHRAVELCVTEQHGCARLANPGPTGSGVKCWGNGGSNRMGSGGIGRSYPGEPLHIKNSLGLPTQAKSLSCSYRNTCVISTENELICVGEGTYGKMLTGNTGSADGTGTSGNPAGPLNIGPGREVLDVSVGQHHICAIIRETDYVDRLSCWGRGDHGRLGLGTSERMGDHDEEVGANLAFVNLGPDVVPEQVVAGYLNTCVISTEGRLFCFGYGYHGVNGQGVTDNLGHLPDHIGTYTPVDLGPGRKVLSVSVASAHACAVLDNNEIKCWGKSGYGKLGLGDKQDRGDDYNEMGGALPYVQFEGN